MAELVDALASGASDLMVVEVQVLFWAPTIGFLTWFSFETLVQIFSGFGFSLMQPDDRLRDFFANA